MLPRLTAFRQHMRGVDPELALTISDEAMLMPRIAKHVADFREVGSYQPTPKDTLSELVAYGKKFRPFLSRPNSTWSFQHAT